MSLGTESSLSVADIAAVTDRNNGNGGFGMGGDWLIALVMLFLFPMFYGNGMWGGGMFGGMGGWANGGMAAMANGALTRADLCSEFNFNGLENSVRAVQTGISDSTFALNNTIMNGFNGVQRDMCTGFANINSGISENRFAAQQGFNALQAQLSSCCCETQRSIDGVNYNLATQGCDTRNTIQNSTRDIIDSQNSGFRAILDKMCQQELAAKDAQIAAQNQRIFGLELSASQQAQNNAIGAMIDASRADILRRTGAECPTPCYVVQPPQPVSFATSCGGQATFAGNGFGGNCGSCCA